MLLMIVIAQLSFLYWNIQQLDIRSDIDRFTASIEKATKDMDTFSDDLENILPKLTQLVALTSESISDIRETTIANYKVINDTPETVYGRLLATIERIDNTVGTLPAFAREMIVWLARIDDGVKRIT